jgi:hypothetical protein
MKKTAFLMVAGLTWLIPVALTFLVSLFLFVAAQQGRDFFNALGFALLATLIAAGICFAYLIPSFIAALRGAPRFLGIYLLNVLAGWSVIGWVASLIWSFVDAPPTPQVVYQVIQGAPATSVPPPLPGSPQDKSR